MLKFIDLFCGCGGLSLGFQMAGFTPVAGIDFKESAISTYQLNFKGSKGICADILSMDKEAILEGLGSMSDIDVIIGGPPCQGFSNANKNYVELDDPRNKLFFEFVKFVEIAKPRVVLIENVPQIVTKDGGFAKKRITEIFEERGYSVTNAILDASEYGIPQKRLRNFFIITKGFMFDMSEIKKSSVRVTVKEAIEELYQFENGVAEFRTLNMPPRSDYQRYLRNPSGEVMNHDIHYPAAIQQERISFVPQGGNWRDVPEELWVTSRTTQTGRTDDLSQKHLMRNLIRWIEYCNRISYPFINISSELTDAEDLRELFITLYVGYIREAINRGMFFQYIEETADISSIKGKFDVKDYLMNKIPNGMGNKFRCTYSNFEFDNWVNRIIKYTCKHLYNLTSKKNQQAIRNILMKLNEVSDVQCKPQDLPIT